MTPVAVAGLVMPLALASPAAAAAGSTISRVGSFVNYGAAPGAGNQVDVTAPGGVLTVTDTATIAAGVGCRQVNATTVTCGQAGGVSYFNANLGDMDDTFTDNLPAPTFRVVLDAGSGSDSVTTGGANDVIHASDGSADTVNCGGGTGDVADGDSLDHFTGCELHNP
ncbi:MULTISPECIES: hypothetical protein [unclassified Streptomyces]|uniref:hypothetical protein n=1 Tax=unclassified Streptomyces TaxID=2593676 RepID=UPI0027418A61|nr:MULTISPECIES: hypothetical protein [unclassified Streptomyces]